MRKNRIYGPFALAMLLVVAGAVSTVAHAQTFSVLYNFNFASGDPVQPSFEGIIAQGRDGSLYSTTPYGGTANSGTVFKITPTGKLATLHNFDGTLECLPLSGLTLATDGNFYGTTEGCGTTMLGVVFKITPGGSLTVLHNFTNTGDGGISNAPPIQGTDGNFYGTTHGSLTGGGSGTVYKFTPSGTLTTLYQFDGTHGEFPAAPLVQGRDGNFYGNTQQGGNSGDGVVFRITSSGKLTVLYNFDGAHGSDPIGPLVQGSDGSFYGTTGGGGTNNTGVVFKITPSGALTVLHDFNGTSDGSRPIAGLIQATDGNFYGTAVSGGSDNFGTIYRISPKGSFSVLHNFDNTAGAYPLVTLLQHTNGILYGDTQGGGPGTGSACACGVFYSLNVGLGPFSSFLPPQSLGKVGASIGIFGQGFTGTTGVAFGGTPATYTVSSDTYLTAKVPAGALSGPVTVTTPGGTLTSNKKFRVTPQITSFSPTSGPVGTVVTITGVSLTQTTQVTFGGVRATTFTVNSDTQVTATVPTAAKTGKIGITTAGGAVASATSFTVTL